MNIWLFYGIIFFCTLTIIGWGFTKQNQFIAGIVAALTIVFTRSLQVLNSYRQFGDSYHYWKVVDAIRRNNELIAPEISTHYPGVDPLMNSPGMHIMTATLIDVLGLQDPTLARAIAPSLYGVACFAVIAALVSRLMGSKWSVVVAYTIVQTDEFIFRQTEYHAQAFGIFFLAFVLLIAVRQIQQTDQKRNLWTLVLAGMGLAISHRFTSFLSIFLLLLTTIGLVIYHWLPKSNVSKSTLDSVFLYSVILAAGLAWYQIVFQTQVVLKSTVSSLSILTGESFGLGPTTTTGGGATTTVFDYAGLALKAALALVALPTILYSFVEEYDDADLFMISFLGATGMAAVGVSLVFIGVFPRIVLIAYIPMVILACQTIQSRIPEPNTRVIASGLMLLIVMMGVIAGTTPSLVDPQSDIRNDGYSGVEPMSGEHEVAGYWIRDYTENSVFGVTVPTFHTVVTFGEQRTSNAEFLSHGGGPYRYVVVDEARKDVPSDTVIYSNGRILIGYNPAVDRSQE